MLINYSNTIAIIPPQTNFPTYKAFITKGNNGIAVRAALKNRWWWALVEKSNPLDNINLYWT
jgi:hypothetical protein